MTIYILLCVTLALLFGGSYYAYRTAFYSPNVDREKIKEVTDPHYTPYLAAIRDRFQGLKNRPCEFVTIQSSDGLTLSGRYYHLADKAPLAIGFHGYKSSWLTDFCGGADITFQMGHNLLLVDERAHGKSQGRSITFGIKERQDLLRWVEYAIERFGPDVKILLYGVSMGGATVIMASELELPVNVKGIVADCPYDEPSNIIKRVLGSKQALYPLIRLGGMLYGRFDLESDSPIKALASIRIPILLLHGDRDDFVPLEMSRNLQHAAPEKIELHIIPGAGHARNQITNPQLYGKILTEFAKKHL